MTCKTIRKIEKWGAQQGVNHIPAFRSVFIIKTVLRKTSFDTDLFAPQEYPWPVSGVENNYVLHCQSSLLGALASSNCGVVFSTQHFQTTSIHTANHPLVRRKEIYTKRKQLCLKSSCQFQLIHIGQHRGRASNSLFSKFKENMQYFSFWQILVSVVSCSCCYL